MSLLAKLLAESGETARPATPATPATPGPKSRRFAKVATSVVSGNTPRDADNRRRVEAQSVTNASDSLAPDTAAIRGRMLALAEADYRDAGLVRVLNEAFLRDCASLTDAQLRALLAMLADDAERKAGRAPGGDTAPILCRHCGPVFVHPSIAAVLPVVNGWPRALGCPWCFVRGVAIPRPSVVPADCAHWKPDSVNPAQGRGQCNCGSWWPNQRHYCADFTPMEVHP